MPTTSLLFVLHSPQLVLLWSCMHQLQCVSKRRSPHRAGRSAHACEQRCTYTCDVRSYHEELYASGPGLSVWYNQRGHWAGLVVFGVSAVLAVASLHIFGVQTHVPGRLLL